MEEYNDMDDDGMELEEGDEGYERERGTKRKWSTEEDQHLAELIKLYGPSGWPKIGSLMIGRTARQCRERWNHKVNPDIKKGNWTTEEDAIILSQPDLVGSWSKLAKFLHGRNDNDVRNRYYALERHKTSKKFTVKNQLNDALNLLGMSQLKTETNEDEESDPGNNVQVSESFKDSLSESLLKHPKRKNSFTELKEPKNDDCEDLMNLHTSRTSNTADYDDDDNCRDDEDDDLDDENDDQKDSNGKTKITKQSWSAAEDQQLAELINMYGPKGWPKIGSLMPGRTARQCRERWHHKINPELKKGNWTLEEDKIIIRNRSIVGSWAKLAKLLPGRNDNDVRNRYYALERLSSKHGAVDLIKRNLDDAYTLLDIAAGPKLVSSATSSYAGGLTARNDDDDLNGESTADVDATGDEAMVQSTLLSAAIHHKNKKQKKLDLKLQADKMKDKLKTNHVELPLSSPNLPSLGNGKDLPKFAGFTGFPNMSNIMGLSSMPGSTLFPAMTAAGFPNPQSLLGNQTGALPSANQLLNMFASSSTAPAASTTSAAATSQASTANASMADFINIQPTIRNVTFQVIEHPSLPQPFIIPPTQNVLPPSFDFSQITRWFQPQSQSQPQVTQQQSTADALAAMTSGNTQSTSKPSHINTDTLTNDSNSPSAKPYDATPLNTSRSTSSTSSRNHNIFPSNSEISSLKKMYSHSSVSMPNTSRSLEDSSCGSSAVAATAAPELSSSASSPALLSMSHLNKLLLASTNASSSSSIATTAAAATSTSSSHAVETDPFQSFLINSPRLLNAGQVPIGGLDMTRLVPPLSFNGQTQNNHFQNLPSLLPTLAATGTSSNNTNVTVNNVETASNMGGLLLPSLSAESSTSNGGTARLSTENGSASAAMNGATNVMHVLTPNPSIPSLHTLLPQVNDMSNIMNIANLPRLVPQNGLSGESNVNGSSPAAAATAVSVMNGSRENSSSNNSAANGILPPPILDLSKLTAASGGSGSPSAAQATTAAAAATTGAGQPFMFFLPHNP